MMLDETSSAIPDLTNILDKLSGKPGRLAIGPDTVETDLARLVLGLMEFLRQLMELQAVRRLEAGTLNDVEEEQIGETLMRSEQAIVDVAEKFGLSAKDLSLDLGPLGKTI